MYNSLKAWFSAARLRTLPLATSVVWSGAWCSLVEGKFNFNISFFCWLTAVFLQILANFANDYGDFEKGTDNENRIGNQRAMQSGSITKHAMTRALVITSVLCLLSGIYLLYISFEKINYNFLLFFVFGIFSIIAALKYTIGRNAYGYRGLGDVSVFIFFGPIAVCGTFFLQAHTINFSAAMMSLSMGCISTAVLNINNIRDFDNDLACNKKTFATYLGKKNARIYLLLLSVFACICYIFSVERFHILFAIVSCFPLFYNILTSIVIYITESSEKYNKYLKMTAISALAAVLILWFIVFLQ